MSSIDDLILRSLLGGRPTGKDQPNIENLTARLALAVKNFEPVPAESLPAFEEYRDSLSRMDPANLDTFLTVALVRDPASETPCEGCGEVHAEDGVKLMVFAMGRADAIRAVALIGPDEAIARAQKAEKEVPIGPTH